MASGSFCNNVGQNCNLIISWNSVKGQGGSTVNATLIAQNRNGWYFDAVVYGYGITINGSQVTGTGARLSASSNGSAGLISHSVWVPYTGNKSITISGYANFNGIINLSNQSISGTVALDKIGSAPTMGSVTAPTTSTVSEKTTSITVKWNKASSYNNSVTYAIGCSINGGSYEWRYPDNNINTTSYTWDIGTPTQGTTYQFAVCCANDIARSDYKYSGVVTINKLSPPTIGDLPSPFNPYSSTTFTIPLTGGSQTNGESFMRRADVYMDNTNGQQVKWYCGSPSYGNTSIVVTVPQAEIINALGTRRYSANIYVIAWIENSNGTRSGYTVKGTTVNINTDGGATPTLSPPTISGGAFNNAATCFIAGISTLNVSSPAASLRRAPSGTTISYKIACTGATTQNGQNANFSGLTAGTKTITVTATDSRGLSVSVSKQVVVQSYAAPTIRAFTATRLDNPNTSAKLVYTLAYSPIYQYTDVDTKGNQLNGISLQEYKKNNFDWSTASNGLVLTNLETDLTYAIQLRIADKVKTTTYVIATQVIPTIKTTMAWRSWGVGIGCIPQTSYALEVNGNSKISGSLDASNQIKSSYNCKSSWSYAPLSAPFRRTYHNNDASAIGIISGDTDNGEWTIATLNEDLYLSYTRKSDRLAGKNETKGYLFKATDENKMVSVLDSENFLNKLYPVGAVYITYNNNNPGNFLGGTWVQFGQGRTLVGEGTGNDGSTSMSFTSNSSGGEYFHALTKDEMPSHNHVLALCFNADNLGEHVSVGPWSTAVTTMHKNSHDELSLYQVKKSNPYSGMSTYENGGNQKHNNISPYITVFFWKRVS